MTSWRYALNAFVVSLKGNVEHYFEKEICAPVQDKLQLRISNGPAAFDGPGEQRRAIDPIDSAQGRVSIALGGSSRKSREPLPRCGGTHVACERIAAGTRHAGQAQVAWPGENFA